MAKILAISFMLLFMCGAFAPRALAGMIKVHGKRAPGSVTASPRYYAVIAACSKYKNSRFNLPKPPFPTFSDKKLLVLYESLLQSKNWNKDNIIVLLNDNATKENILAALGHMADIIGPDDYFLFSWSGHGTEVIDSDTDESTIDPADSYDEALCPHDIEKNDHGLSNMITDDELNLLFSAITCREMTLVFDCCLSGGLADRNTAIDSTAAAAFTERFKKRIRQNASGDVNGGNRVVLMSTRPDFVERGIFLTGFPLMTGMAVACSHPVLSDGNHDGMISAEEAFSIAKPLVYLQSSSLWIQLWLYSWFSYKSSQESGAFLYSLIDTSFGYLMLQIESRLLTGHYMGNFPIISDNTSGEFPLFAY